MTGAPHKGSSVSLRPVTAETVRQVCALAVARDQRGNVSPNALSIAQAYFEPAAWFRAIYADDAPVGFVLLYDPTLPDASPHPEFPDGTLILWRFMIDRAFQGFGFGRHAITLILDHARTRPGIDRVAASFVPGPHGAGGFYAGLGFRETGRLLAKETEIEIAIDL